MIGADFLRTLPERLRAVLRESAEQVAARARTAAPVHSGELSRSIDVIEDAQGVGVCASAPQAVIIELGSYRRAAQPFLRPALLDEREALKARIRRILTEMDHD